MSQIPGVQLGEYQLSDLEYVDDTTLFTESVTDMSSALQIYSKETAQLGISVNWSKTKLMHIGDGPDPTSIDIDGTEVEFIAFYTYLGSTVINTGDLQEEINRRRGLEVAAMNFLCRPLWWHLSISWVSKMWVYSTLVIAILLFGLKTWPLTQTLTKQLDAFDVHCLRMIEYIRWQDHISNEEDLSLNKKKPGPCNCHERPPSLVSPSYMLSLWASDLAVPQIHTGRHWLEKAQRQAMCQMDGYHWWWCHKAQPATSASQRSCKWPMIVVNSCWMLPPCQYGKSNEDDTYNMEMTLLLHTLLEHFISFMYIMYMDTDINFLVHYSNQIAWNACCHYDDVILLSRTEYQHHNSLDDKYANCTLSKPHQIIRESMQEEQSHTQEEQLCRRRHSQIAVDQKNNRKAKDRNQYTWPRFC